MRSLRRSIIASAVVALILGVLSAPATHAQTPAHTRLLEDRVLLEQLPGTISRALAALDPDPEVQAKTQRLFQEAVAHYTSGHSGECRRILYEALALVIGREWTDRDDYWRSLLLRADTVVTDPQRPLIVRLTQIYPPSYQPVAPLTLRTRLVGGADQQVRDLGEIEDIGVDFIDEPLSFAVDLSGLDDGQYYRIEARISEGAEPLRRLKVQLYVLSDLDETRASVERRLAKIDGHDSAKATVRYPFDRALQVNLGKLEPERFDFAAEIDRSMELLAELEAGNDPLYGAIGDHERHYRFDEAREIMPYRILVPAGYDGTRPFPLMVALHGMGGTHDTLFEMNGGILPRAAGERGFIMVSPMGYRRHGGYGSDRVEGASASPARRQLTRLSYLDVLNVLELVRAEYEIDHNRIYLMGGSMGGGGTWRIASRHPEIWAAIAPICPGTTPDEIDLEGMRHIPVVVTHGDADATVPVERSRTMTAAMEELGMTYEYHEIPGGGHLILKEALQPTMDFLARYRRNPEEDR